MKKIKEYIVLTYFQIGVSVVGLPVFLTHGARFFQEKTSSFIHKKKSKIRAVLFSKIN